MLTIPLSAARVAVLSLSMSGCLSVSPERIGTVSRVQGNVYVARDGLPRPLRITFGDGLYVSDVLQTEPRSRLNIALEGARQVTIGANSRVAVAKQSAEDGLTFTLDRGTVRSHPHGEAPEAPLRSTPVHVVANGVRTTGEEDFIVWVEEPVGASPPDPEDRARQTWAFNIGSARPVVFGSAGVPLSIPPGFFSAALSDYPPILPVPLQQAQDLTNTVVQATSFLVLPTPALATSPKPAMKSRTVPSAGATIKGCRPQARQLPSSKKLHGKRRPIRCV